MTSRGQPERRVPPREHDKSRARGAPSADDAEGSAPACTRHPGAECVPWPTGDTDDYTLFVEGDALFDAMVGAIGGALHRIELESFIYAADEVGWRIAAALADRAAHGVQVRVLVDAAGSMFTFSNKIERFLQRHGVIVRRFHRWSWSRPLRFNRRNHRKLLSVDERVTFIGGFNLHRQSSHRAFGVRRWRDTHVLVEGALARHAAALFDAMWAGDPGAPVPPAQGSGDIVVPNHSRICRHQIHCLYHRLFRSARSSLFVTTPYFVPDHRTQNELAFAARRGVDVRLLLPGKSDVPIARWAARAAYRKLLQAGIRLFEYQPRVLHAKTAVIDGAVATIGTANLDYRSLFVNHELNLFSANRGLSEAMVEQFHLDLREAVELTETSWSRRPWSGMIAESVGWLARRWL